MDGISGYILSLVCTAILCGLIALLFDNQSPISGVVKLVLGIIMTIVVLKPVIQENVFSLETYFEGLSNDGAWAVTAGSNYAKSLQEEIIKERTETYILDKASQLGADITVDVSLDESNLPIAACFSGQISPYVKEQLEDFMSKQLAIQEECLSWK